MSNQKVLDRILSERFVAILRMKSSQNILDIVDALIEGGINVLEITSNTPNFTQYIEQARKKHIEAIIGAGTILTKVQAREAITSGAQFLVTPNTNPQIIEVARDREVPVIMGAFTPSEVVEAHQAGADIIKLFPATVGGIPYMKALMGPLDNIRIFAVGGVDLDNMAAWLQAGAAGVGLGSKLIAKASDGGIDIDQTYKNATLAKKIVHSLGG